MKIRSLLAHIVDPHLLWKEAFKNKKKSLHEGKNFPCTHCGSTFTDKGNLQKQKKSHHEGQNFPCTHCGSTFTDKGNLQKHIKSVHEGQRFPCTHCQYKATLKGDLQKHVKSIHEGQKFHCTHCQYKATQKGHLQKHIKGKSSHAASEDPHLLRKNIFRYTSKRSMKQKVSQNTQLIHFQSKHEGVNYACNQCKHLNLSSIYRWW